MASVDALLKLTSGDVARMSRNELASVVSQLASAGNKRLRRLEKTEMGTESRAYKSAMEKGNFSVKGKTQGQLQNEFKRVKSFLSSKTSSVSGWKAERQKVYERIGGGFESEESEKSFWQAYRKLAESDLALHKSYGSSETQRNLHSEMSRRKRLTSEEIARYKKEFPQDTRSASTLKRLTGIDRAVIRTQLQMVEDYTTNEIQEAKNYGNGAFFTIGGDS